MLANCMVSVLDTNSNVLRICRRAETEHIMVQRWREMKMQLSFDDRVIAFEWLVGLGREYRGLCFIDC